MAPRLVRAVAACGMVAAAAAAGCADSPVAPRADPAAAAPPSASAAAVIAREQFEILQIIDNPCNGEPVLVTGTQQLLIAFSEGGGEHVHLHLTSQGLTGIGVLTQTRYSVSETALLSQNLTLGAAEATAWSRLTFVSHGPAPDFELFQLIHITISATGVPTAVVVRDRAECRGSRRAGE